MAYVQQVRFGCPNSNLTFFLMSMRLEPLLHPGKKLTSYIECKHTSVVFIIRKYPEWFFANQGAVKPPISFIHTLPAKPRHTLRVFAS